MSELNNCFKEAVCIDVQRVFDSCSDRDCIFELPVTLTDDSPIITDDLDIVRTRCAEVEATCISVDSVPFKNGYYAVDITYRFKITAEAFSKGFCKPQNGTILCGTALWNKRVILYGSEGNSKVFTSAQHLEESRLKPCDSSFSCCNANSSMPLATVNVVDPIALDTKFICVPKGMPKPGYCQNEIPPYPPCVPICPPFPCHECGDCSEHEHSATHSKHCPPPCPPPCPPCPPPCPPHCHYKRELVVTLGLFSIIQLSRPVSLLVPAYDYCIPCKDCASSSTSEAPCEVFDRIEFPSEQFFPQPGDDTTNYGNCCNPEFSNCHENGCHNCNNC